MVPWFQRDGLSRFSVAAFDDPDYAKDGPSVREGRRWLSSPGPLFDLVAAVALISLLSVLLALVALLVSLSGRPILYPHERIGYGGRSFRCLKFRTMVVDGERLLAERLARDPDAAREWAATHKLRDDPRVTLVGRFLRKFSLDELPQLFNVVLGDMSLVGPRPIVQAEIRKYGRQMRFYTSVRPGMTGLWQVSGRCRTTYARRVACDRLYVSRRSFAMDCAILARTVPAVVSATGRPSPPSPSRVPAPPLPYPERTP